MQASTEIRWFFEERQEIILLEDWFMHYHLQLNTKSFERQDYYMRLPGVTTLGLKIREPKKNKTGDWEGKLEAKVFTKELGVSQTLHGNSGRANQWTKFSFSLAAGETTLTEVLNELGVGDNIASGKNFDYWIPMDKSRILLKYDLDKKDFTKGDEQIQEGCGVELTMLQLQNKIYFSFGLEAFSASGKHEENLFLTLKHVFDEVKISGLAVGNSLSYPEFIAART